MTIMNASSNVNSRNSQYGSLSKIEIFIIARIVELVKIGWSKTAIADALGVNAEFVERALLVATNIR